MSVIYRGRSGEPSRQVGVRMPESFIKELQAMAKEKRMSMSYLCEELIRIGLEECERPAVVEERSTVIPAAHGSSLPVG